MDCYAFQGHYSSMSYYHFTSIAARFIAVTILFGVFSLSAKAAVVNVNPPINCLGPSCFTTNENGGNDTAAFSQLSGLELLYKAESSDSLSATPQAESGSFKDSYSTVFSFLGGGEDYTGAQISYDGGPSINCTAPCYLVVKGGNHEPARYLFDLSLNPYNWDGVMMLNISGFWQNGVRGSDGDGSISHVAIYGVSPIPVPAAFWLFGTALIGFIGYSRRRTV